MRSPRKFFFLFIMTIIVIYAIYSLGVPDFNTSLAGIEPAAAATRTEPSVKIKTLADLITVRGNKITFDAPPLIKEGRTLIPVRAVMNGLGAEVEWNSTARTVTITREYKKIVLDMESQKAYFNGQEVTLDVPAQIINDRTYVPLRFVAQALGEKVDYVEATGEINIGG